MAITRWVDDNEARRIRDEMLHTALPVVFAGPLLVETERTTETLPVVQLDPTGRPDVVDMFRVVQVEGIQAGSDVPPRYVLCDGHGYRETTIAISDPVELVFKFVLAWPEHDTVFKLMLQRRQLIITTRSVEEHIEGGDLLVTTIAANELQSALESWQTLRAEGK